MILTYKEKQELLIEYMTKLPTGIKDPDCLKKQRVEMGELMRAMEAGDVIDVAQEAADAGWYYPLKAEVNGLLTPDDRQKITRNVAKLVKMDVDLLLDVALAKYALRARPGNPKDKPAEREAVERVLGIVGV